MVVSTGGRFPTGFSCTGLETAIPLRRVASIVVGCGSFTSLPSQGQSCGPQFTHRYNLAPRGGAGEWMPAHLAALFASVHGTPIWRRL